MASPTLAQGVARNTGWQWGIRDSGHSSVAYHWDMRLGKPAAATNVGSVTYDSTLGMNCAAGNCRFNGLDDTAIITQGTIMLEIQRSIIDWDNDTFASGFWVDSSGNTVNTGNQYIIRIIENGASAREIFAYRNTASSARLTIQVEGASDDDAQPIFPARYYGLQRYTSLATEVDDTWAIFAITWKDGRIYTMLDGQVIGSFARSIVDGDIDTLHLGGFGTSYFSGYIRQVQILNTCIAPTIAGPRQCIIGDSFGQRASSRIAPTADTAAGYRAIQGSRSYIAAEPQVTEATAAWKERGNVAWMMSGHFTVLQRLATLKYGIWPPLYNASQSGKAWRSDLSNQITSGQTNYVIEVDPEILWCLGSVNDINVADQTYDFVADAGALIDTMAAGCRNLRRVIFVETFATPDTIRPVDRDNYKVAWDGLRAAMPSIGGYETTNAKGETVTVEYLRVWDQWAPGGTVPGPYAIGTVPTSDGPVSEGSNGDIHPTGTGTIKMAEILWPTFKEACIHRPNRL